MLLCSIYFLLWWGDDLSDAAKSYAPINWDITIEKGGIGFKNDTDKKQYVQVIVKKGRVGTIALSADGKVSCQTDLEGNTPNFITYCVLNPNDSFGIDLDFATHKSAHGTLQVELG